MNNSTEAPIHYKYNGQLYCPVVGHAVAELVINQNEKFPDPTEVDHSVKITTTRERNSELSSFSSSQHDSRQQPEQQILPNPRTRAFLEEFNTHISQIRNDTDLTLSSNVLQSFSNFQRVYENLKNENDKNGSLETYNNDKIEIIEISDDEDELQEPGGIEIIEISDDEDDNKNTAQYYYSQTSNPYASALLSRQNTTSANLAYLHEARPILPVNIGDIEDLRINVRNIEPLPGMKINRYPTLPVFKNPTLRKVALTHSGINKDVSCNYERLEHLGDRVLQHLANHMAFDRAEKHPLLRQYKKRIMDHIEYAINFFVSNKTLAVIGHILDIRTLVVEEAGGPRNLTTKDIADYVEALIGALYEDNNRNFDTIREWYEPITGTLLDRILYKAIFKTGPDDQDVFNWAYDMYFHLNKRFIRATP
ncbi:1736_t:CDS:2 [Ambispora gerdemannii]|uniref:1736_t:CDS:1 n=1 Tax=Ambispora gerdemannii TaxID=144530 RepID=A0A9N9CWK5_9GLOM|nr:1736_t:CDS:2 [Ambispora gerdemannii]